EQELMNLINAHRQANGVGALKASPNLSRAAAWMSEDLNASGNFSHTDSLGRSAFTRVIQCGYSGNGAGENIAMTGSAASAFNLFLTSPGHNQNMLNPAWSVIGVGQTGRMWVVDFGTVDDSNQPWDSGAPPPAATTQPPSSGGGSQPTSIPSAGNPPSNSTGGVVGAAPTVPGAVRTVLPAPFTPQYKLPSNVPVKRAMLQMVAAE
ncbi:MAG: CAP domain-containing protein, partial [Dehalococcoidia bacterium]